MTSLIIREPKPREATGGLDEALSVPPVSASRRSLLAGMATIGTGSFVGCLGIGESSDLEEVTYRHRFNRSGVSVVVNDIGVELGAWEDEGLDVTFETSSGSAAAAQSVASGNDEFGNANLAAVVGLVEEGAPLRIIANIQNPMDGVLSLAETGIETWGDLEGKVVGRFPWGSTGPIAMAAMRADGGDPDKVTLRNIDPGSQEVLLMEGKIDAAVCYPPLNATTLEANGYEANFLLTSDVLNYLGVTLFTRDELVQDHSEMVDRFVRGWLMAHQLYITRPDTVIDIYKELATGVDEQIARRNLGPNYAARILPEVELEHGMGWISESLFGDSLEVFEGVGILDTPTEAEASYTNQFIEDNQDLALETAQIYQNTLEEEYPEAPDYV